MSQAFLSLGSNFPHAIARLACARVGIGDLAECELIAASAIYVTEPQGYDAQPWFHNQVLRIETFLGARTLLKKLLALETQLGRRRDGPRFGPRCIDIDLLLYEDLELADPFCTVPHPRLCERAFCLVPLLELCPDLTIKGVSVSELLRRLDWRLAGNKIFQ